MLFRPLHLQCPTPPLCTQEYEIEYKCTSSRSPGKVLDDRRPYPTDPTLPYSARKKDSSPPGSRHYYCSSRKNIDTDSPPDRTFESLLCLYEIHMTQPTIDAPRWKVRCMEPHQPIRCDAGNTYSGVPSSTSSTRLYIFIRYPAPETRPNRDRPCLQSFLCCLVAGPPYPYAIRRN